ncbi:MAG: phenylphosphate carboxylase subunit delta, partial [Betaproteobacteria bacterium]|nr:phenylphosphate carboxylase subunit delta [Betaproteobacteria bacterium]
CGFAATTREAPEIVKRHAHFISTQSAGAGAVREVCETILKAQGKLDAALAPYLA